MLSLLSVEAKSWQAGLARGLQSFTQSARQCGPLGHGSLSAQLGLSFVPLQHRSSVHLYQTVKRVDLRRRRGTTVRHTRTLFIASAALLASVWTGCASETGKENDESVASARVELRVREVEGGTGRVEYVVANRSDRSIHVLRYQTAADENPDQLLVVSQAGVEVPYLGPRILRAPTGASHYVRLEPGEQLAGEVDLSELYALREGGPYEVTIVPSSRSFVLEADEVEVSTGAPLSVAIEASRVDVAAHAEALTVSYCDEDQGHKIGLAQSEAHDLASNARDYYSYHGPSDERVVRWFGVQPSWNKKVPNTLNHINTRLERDNVVYVCSTVGCETAVAWTTPLSPNAVYLCPRFFDSPVAEGEFSQASTIIHEISHMGPGGYTQDTTNWAYANLDEDPNAVKNAVHELGQNNPIGASWNADSYNYYAVDPPL